MKTLTENIALLSVLAITISLFNLSAFYGVFGINIVHYIDVSEIILSETFDLFAIIVLLISILPLGLLRWRVSSSEYNTLYDYLKGQYNLSAYKINLISMASIICITSILFMISSHHARRVRDESEKGGMVSVMIMENDSIKTSPNLIWIGRTKNYVFLYNRNLKQTRILKSEDIKEIRMYLK